MTGMVIFLEEEDKEPIEEEDKEPIEDEYANTSYLTPSSYTTSTSLFFFVDELVYLITPV
jgi:hypothetical protein